MRLLNGVALLLSLLASAPAAPVAPAPLLAAAQLQPLPRVRVCPGGGPGGGTATWSRDDSCTRALKPRGANYIRLNQTSIGWAAAEAAGTREDPPGNAYHSTFSLGHWNASHADAALREMAALSYNLVRVFIDDGRTLCGLDAVGGADGNGAGGGPVLGLGLVPVIPCTAATSRPNGINGPFHVPNRSRGDAGSGDGAVAAPRPDWLSGEYMDNFAAFVRLATAHGVYVMPTLQRFPCNERFLAATAAPAPPNPHLISEGNADYLHAPTVGAKATYLASFAMALRERVGPELMSTIFGFSLENEARGYGDSPPFSSPGLMLPDAAGVARNMSVPGDRRALLDAGFAAWANASAAAVRAVDPDAMVTAGMFTYYAVGHSIVTPPGPTGGGDPRFPPNPAHLSKHSSLSYLDIHVYPSAPPQFNATADLMSEDFAAIDRARVPLLLGEFGAFRKPYPTFDAARRVLQDLVLTSCRAPFGFQGWLVWTWDTFEQGWMLWDLADPDPDAAANVTATAATTTTLGTEMAPGHFDDPCLASD